jgi:DNA-binding CsgD family transcriptional regulator
MDTAQLSLLPARETAPAQDTWAPANDAGGAEPADAGRLMRAMLDHLQVGLLAVAGDGRVLSANRAALRLCAQRGELALEHGRLAAATRGGTRLARAIAAARCGRWALIKLDGTDAALLTVAVVPLHQLTTHETPVLLLFGQCHVAESLAMQLFAREHGLTPTETRVLCGLVDGQRPRQIARNHDVALSTVRSQVGSVRAKTGARSITELTRAVVGLPPVMPIAAGVR